MATADLLSLDRKRYEVAMRELARHEDEARRWSPEPPKGQRTAAMLPADAEHHDLGRLAAGIQVMTGTALIDAQGRMLAYEFITYFAE